MHVARELQRQGPLTVTSNVLVGACDAHVRLSDAAMGRNGLGRSFVVNGWEGREGLRDGTVGRS
jgi:hypothetical protein